MSGELQLFKVLHKLKVIIYFFKMRVRKQHNSLCQIGKEWDKLSCMTSAYVVFSVDLHLHDPAWFQRVCHRLVLSNPMKWKIDNKGFKLLLSLPQLFGCCFDDRIHLCSTQIHKVMVISGTENLGGFI